MLLHQAAFRNQLLQVLLTLISSLLSAWIHGHQELKVCKHTNWLQKANYELNKSVLHQKGKKKKLVIYSTRTKLGKVQPNITTSWQKAHLDFQGFRSPTIPCPKRRGRGNCRGAKRGGPCRSRAPLPEWAPARAGEPLSQTPVRFSVITEPFLCDRTRKSLGKDRKEKTSEPSPRTTNQITGI